MIQPTLKAGCSQLESNASPSAIESIQPASCYLTQGCIPSDKEASVKTLRSSRVNVKALKTEHKVTICGYIRIPWHGGRKEKVDSILFVDLSKYVKAIRSHL